MRVTSCCLMGTPPPAEGEKRERDTPSTHTKRESPGARESGLKSEGRRISLGGWGEWRFVCLRRGPDRQRQRQPASQTDRQTDRQTARQTDRQTDDLASQPPARESVCIEEVFVGVVWGSVD